jgi:hypothetical protein
MTISSMASLSEPFRASLRASLTGLAIVALANTLSSLNAWAEPSNWQVQIQAQDEAASNTLPILRLDRGDWVSAHHPANKTAHAWRAIQLEAQAHHASGWSMGVLERAQASLHASPDTVKVAALNQLQANPQSSESFAIDARYQFWQGRGISLQTPAWRLPVATPWTLSAKFQALQLKKLRTAQLDGAITYKGAGAYDFDLRADRLGSDLNAPFVAAPEPQGWGSSLSLDVRGQLGGGFDVRIQARDILSILKWQLTRDTSTLQSANTTRNPDGTLNYAPLIAGQQQNQTATQRMDTDWRINLSAPPSTAPEWLPSGHWTLEAQRHSMLNQWWLGWQTQRTQLAVEPNLGALKIQFAANGWFAGLATNRLDTTATLRNWQLGWRGAL